MPSILSLLFALAALCSSAIAATPFNVAPLETSTESSTHSRSLLGVCKTVAYGQCGGDGNGGRHAGVWCLCPSGFFCKHFNKHWYSCQKGKSKKKLSSAQKKRAALIARKKALANKKKKALALKRRKAAAAAAKRRKSRRTTNKRTRDSYSSKLSGYNGYQNPQQFNAGPACDKVDDVAKNGDPHWCGRPKVTGWPVSKTPGVKVGRQTVFNGPPFHTGHCAKPLWPTDSSGPFDSQDWREKYVKVALSSKYMKGYGQAPCDMKVCIRAIGYDEVMNPNPPSFWRDYVGTVMPGIVYDRCGECDDDHLDILASYPYSKAPQGEGKGATHNKIWGNKKMYIALDQIYGIGIAKVEWGWNPTGMDCNKYF